MVQSELMTGDALAAHEPPLLTAARIKLQTLQELAESHLNDEGTEVYPSVPVIQDYNLLLDLLGKAAPHLKSALPQDILTPYHARYQSAMWSKRSSWAQLISFGKSDTIDDEYTKLITYRELSTFCRQIARLLK